MAVRDTDGLIAIGGSISSATCNWVCIYHQSGSLMKKVEMPCEKVRIRICCLCVYRILCVCLLSVCLSAVKCLSIFLSDCLDICIPLTLPLSQFISSLCWVGDSSISVATKNHVHNVTVSISIPNLEFLASRAVTSAQKHKAVPKLPQNLRLNFDSTRRTLPVSVILVDFPLGVVRLVNN